MQRLFDIIFSGLALILLSLLFILIIVLLRLTGEGEVFYRQVRIGKNKLPFKTIKFATMLKNSAQIGTGTVTVKNDPRVLPLGGFLRKTKINELPQLLNVFFGDMSLIGPRPLTERGFNVYPAALQDHITQVRPGLSGIGSIVFRNEEDMMDARENTDHFFDTIIMPYKGELEDWYVNHKTLAVYFVAIFLTIWVVLTGKGGAIYKAFKTLPPSPEVLRPFIYGKSIEQEQNTPLKPSSFTDSHLKEDPTTVKVSKSRD